jgi:threonylcarbamoyladenosine tRNA methylthiotransferase MtaB
MEGVVPANVRAKRSKMLRVVVKKTPCLYEKSPSNRTVLFESENKLGYIHGFITRTSWNWL